MVQIVALPNPFKENEVYTCEVPAGTCLAAMLQGLSDPVSVAINGVRIHPSQWETTTLQEKDWVLVTREPKDFLFTLLQMTVMAAGMIYSMVATPPRIPTPAGLSPDRYANLSGVGNQISKFQVIPKLYGEAQITPPLAANYYTKINEKGVQKLIIMLCLGYGPLAIKLDVPTSLGKEKISHLIVGKNYSKDNQYYPKITYYKHDSDISLDGVSYGYTTKEPLIKLDQFPISTLFFGNTDINDYDGVYFEIGHPSQISIYTEDVEVDEVRYTFFGPKQGMLTPDDGVDYTDHKSLGKVITEVIIPLTIKNESKNYRLQWFSVNNTRVGGVDSEPYVKGTVPNTDYAVIWLDFAALYSSGMDGSILPAGVKFLVQYKSNAPGTEWINYDNSLEEAASEKCIDGVWAFHAYTTKQTFKSLEIHFKDSSGEYVPGAYAIKLTRTHTGLTEYANWATDCTWQELRSVSRVPPWKWDVPGTHGDHAVLMALSLTHSGQLNGNVDAVSIKVQSVLPVWDTKTWTWKPTSNPAWAYIDVLTGYSSLSRLDRDTEIDKAAIYQWAQWCDNSAYLETGKSGFITQYNKYHTDDEPMLERIRAIAATGYASWAYIDQKFSIAAEFASSSSFIPRQMLTPRNSWNFSLSREFSMLPHAYRVKYIDPIAWEEAEVIVYGYLEDGTRYTKDTAERYEVLNTTGITSVAQACQYGRYLFNISRYRKASYTLDTDLETLGLSRGDCLNLAYDVLIEGQAYGRVAEVIKVDKPSGTTITHLVLDEDITLTPTEKDTYMGLFIRRSDDVDMSQLRSADNSLKLNNLTDQDIVYKAGSRVPLALPLLISHPLQDILNGDLFVFGKYKEETLLAKVVRMTPRPDLSVTLGLVPASQPEYLLPSVTESDLSTDVSPVTKNLKKASPRTPQQVSIAFVGDRLLISPTGKIKNPVKIRWIMPAGSYFITDSKGNRVESKPLYGVGPGQVTPVSRFIVEWWMSANASAESQTSEDIRNFGVSEIVSVQGIRELSVVLNDVPSISYTFASTSPATDGGIASATNYLYIKAKVAAQSPYGHTSPYSAVAVKYLAPDSSQPASPIINENSYDTWLSPVFISKLLTDNLQNQNLILTQELDTPEVKYLLPASGPGSATSDSVALTRKLPADQIGDPDSGVWIIRAYVKVTNSGTNQVSGVKQGKSGSYKLELYQTGVTKPLEGIYLNDVKFRTSESAWLQTSLPLTPDEAAKSFRVKVTRTAATRLASATSDSFAVSYSVVISRANTDGTSDLDPAASPLS